MKSLSTVIIEMLEMTNEVEKNDLSELLRKTVEEGASIGFLPPVTDAQALDYWKNLSSPGVYLWVAKINNKVVGSIQLHECTKPNGLHRVEIAKLMTHPEYRRNGIGRLLMQEAEKFAKTNGKSLIVLDTREGDSSNLLYSSLGYQKAGTIPRYSKSSNGKLHATVYYYKEL